MPALAYLLMPVTGTIAYFSGRTPRTRFHGLQAVVVGVLWPAALYAGSAISPEATRIAFAAGAVVWLVLLLGTAVGRDPTLPVVGRVLKRWAANPPRDATPDEG